MNMSIPPPPPSYMRELPATGVTITTVDGRTLEHPTDVTTWASLSPGAVAQLPSGLQYIKTGDIWLLAPMPNPLPMVLTGRVPGHQDYWVIQQAAYTGDNPIDNKDAAMPITFNVPMSRAKEGDLSGSGDSLFGARASGGAYDEDVDQVQIYISFDTVSGKPLTWALPPLALNVGKTVSSFEVDVTATKGELARDIAQEVERIFYRTTNVPIALLDKALCKEADFTDLFLVDLVERAEGVFQPTLAVRVPPRAL